MKRFEAGVAPRPGRCTSSPSCRRRSQSVQKPSSAAQARSLGRQSHLSLRHLVRRGLRHAKRPHRANPVHSPDRQATYVRASKRSSSGLGGRGLRSPQTNWRPCVGAWPISPASSQRVGQSDPSVSSRCVSLKGVEKDGWQDRLRASEWLPCSPWSPSRVSCVTDRANSVDRERLCRSRQNASRLRRNLCSARWASEPCFSPAPAPPRRRRCGSPSSASARNVAC